MKINKRHLIILSKVKRKEYHPLIHKLHKKHKISKKTLFYIKEYGPHSHVSRTIFKESIKILLLASIISAFGGLALERIKVLFIYTTPLLVLLPALNDMIGDYGSIVSSKFSTMLHEGKIKKRWWGELEIKKLFWQILTISLTTAVISLIVAFIVSMFSSYVIDFYSILKIVFIVIADVMLLVCLLFLTSIFAGLYYYKKKEDPNNFLIPITTSVADFGNMVILATLVSLLF